VLELDKRITDKTKIFNRLNADDARQYTGQAGYFTDSLAGFTDFRTVFYGVLREAGDGGFELENQEKVFEFFLPQKFVVSDNCWEPKSAKEDIADLNERLRDIETDFPSVLERIEELERSLTSLDARVELLEGILYYNRRDKNEG
jgi:hypothetical protein